LGNKCVLLPWLTPAVIHSVALRTIINTAANNLSNIRFFRLSPFPILS
jgi:hypothetical protein